MTIPRRAALAAPLLLALPARAQPRWTGRQFHNQPEDSHQHRFLVELWDGVRAETGGRLSIQVFAQNASIPGSDPAALRMLVAGELEFFTLMGGILGQAVPLMEIQGLPFAFRSHAEVHRVMDGPFGELLRRECLAQGIVWLPHATMENGFRHISSNKGPVRNADDLRGLRIRVPDGELFRDLFRSLGAEPVTVNIRELYSALREGRVDAQENPLVVTEVNRLFEVQRHMSLTDHMWSGFNLLANARLWNSLPEDVRDIAARHARRAVAAQRAYTDALNRELETRLASRGMVFNRADTDSFRRVLAGGFYARWRERFGNTAWAALEAEVGRLG
ncbi:MAG: TRAP transporter substrate-binding protein [Acetobacteraceae bacterium]|nr:TRAP transporter substrate-binding protein [Acetobacteraceae bacterium]